VFHVDIEDPFEQLGPAHARWFSLSLGVIGRGFGSALWRSGNDLTAQLRVGRQHAVEANEMETRARHQSRQAFRKRLVTAGLSRQNFSRASRASRKWKRPILRFPWTS
jgi:hypothetical protein